MTTFTKKKPFFQMYGYCPQWSLTWEYRKKGILDEIKAYS